MNNIHDRYDRYLWSTHLCTASQVSPPAIPAHRRNALHWKWAFWALASAEFSVLRKLYTKPWFLPVPKGGNVQPILGINTDSHWPEKAGFLEKSSHPNAKVTPEGEVSTILRAPAIFELHSQSQTTWQSCGCRLACIQNQETMSFLLFNSHQ